MADEQLLQALRAYGMTFRDLGRDFGVRMGLHTTDATALVEILEAQDRGTPLTQSALSDRVGLTRGATSTLLNRLEDAGHVRRVRDHTDRRVVTLHATDGVEAMVDRYFDPLLVEAGAVMQRYSPAMLAEFGRFLTDYCAAMNRHMDNPA